MSVKCESIRGIYVYVIRKTLKFHLWQHIISITHILEPCHHHPPVATLIYGRDSINLFSVGLGFIIFTLFLWLRTTMTRRGKSIILADPRRLITHVECIQVSFKSPHTSTECTFRWAIYKYPKSTRIHVNYRALLSQGFSRTLPPSAS